MQNKKNGVPAEATSKFTKYITYAVGEIVLVVIGILIAIQLNTAFSNVQRMHLEKKILIEIENNLKGDLIDIEDEIQSFEIVISTDSILIQHFKNNKPFNDSIGGLIQIFQMSPHLSPARSGYRLLESKGIDLITYDSLRIKITDLYERSYPYYTTYANERFHMIENVIQPYIIRNFYLENYDKWPYRKRVPINYEDLLNDPEIISLIQTSSFHASLMRNHSKNLKAEIIDLQEEIIEYLNN